MAGSFIDAFNKAFRNIVNTAVDMSEGFTPKRERPKSSNKGLLGRIGTWQKSREIMERTKGRISRIQPLEAISEQVTHDEEMAGYPNAPERPSLIQRAKSALGLDQQRKLIREREFSMAVNDDPAFMAWVNRVGAEAGIGAGKGRDLNKSRLDWLCKLFGVEDPLALYEYVSNDKDFGYAEFQAAYATDGKNHGKVWNPAYKLNDKISMHMVQISLFKKFPIYELLTA